MYVIFLKGKWLDSVRSDVKENGRKMCIIGEDARAGKIISGTFHL
jgi:hypothetical protein